MTENEWLRSENPATLLGFNRNYDKRLSLFAVACCRQVCHLIPDDVRRVIEYIERGIEGERFGKSFPSVREWLQRLASENNRYYDAVSAVECALSITKALQYRHFDLSRHDVIVLVHQTAEYAYAAAPSNSIRRCQANFIRDLYGNPFRRCHIDSSLLTWNSGTIPSIAQQIYDKRIMPSGRFDNS